MRTTIALIVATPTLSQTSFGADYFVRVREGNALRVLPASRSVRPILCGASRGWNTTAPCGKTARPECAIGIARTPIFDSWIENGRRAGIAS